MSRENFEILRLLNNNFYTHRFIFIYYNLSNIAHIFDTVFRTSYIYILEFYFFSLSRNNERKLLLRLLTSFKDFHFELKKRKNDPIPIHRQSELYAATIGSNH